MKEPHRSLKIWLPAVRSGSGADVYTERLAMGLDRAGHEAIVEWFPHRYELMPWSLKRVSAPEKVDIIHANSWQAFAFKREGIPLIVTEHHFVLDPSFAPYRSVQQMIYHEMFIAQCLKLSYRAADAIVAVSEHTAKAVRAKFGCDTIVIHNWLDVERYRNLLPQVCSEEHSTRPFRLLFVGNPSRRKGADLLPELARRLGSQFEIWCLGGLRQRLKASPEYKNMVAIPPVAPDEMPQVYAQVDAVLIPARYEAFGYVALEAMASGKPVVAFDTTGTREICEHEKTAFLSPIDDLKALEFSCRRLRADPALGERMGKAGRSRAQRRFSEARAIANYVDVYNAVSC